MNNAVLKGFLCKNDTGEEYSVIEYLTRLLTHKDPVIKKLTENLVSHLQTTDRHPN